jgi:hypothetical protein
VLYTCTTLRRPQAAEIAWTAAFSREPVVLYPYTTLRDGQAQESAWTAALSRVVLYPCTTLG